MNNIKEYEYIHFKYILLNTLYSRRVQVINPLKFCIVYLKVFFSKTLHYVAEFTMYDLVLEYTSKFLQHIHKLTIFTLTL